MSMRQRSASLIVAVAGAALLCPCVQAAGVEADAKTRTEALVEGFKQVHVAASGSSLSAAEKSDNEAAFAKLDAFFDYPTLSREALGPQAGAFNKAQRAQFNKDFRELVRLVSFNHSAGFVRQANIDISAPEEKGAQCVVVMHAVIPEQDAETRVSFVWQRSEGIFKVVDVLFDGVSFVKDYQNQFGKLIKKDGVAGLLRKVSARLAREQQG